MEDLTYDQRVENEKKKAMDAYRWTLDNPVKANIIGTTGILGGIAGGIGSGYLANKYLGTGTVSATVAGGILSHLIASSLASYLVRKAEKESIENEARIRKFRETGKIASFRKRAGILDQAGDALNSVKQSVNNFNDRVDQGINNAMELGRTVHRNRGIASGVGALGGGLLAGLPAAYIGDWIARRLTKNNKRDLGTSLIGLASGIAAAYFGGKAISNWAARKYDEGLSMDERLSEGAYILKNKVNDMMR